VNRLKEFRAILLEGKKMYSQWGKHDEKAHPHISTNVLRAQKLGVNILSKTPQQLNKLTTEKRKEILMLTGTGNRCVGQRQIWVDAVTSKGGKPWIRKKGGKK